MTAFPCCTCPEPPSYDPEVDDPLPKYRNKCGCPSVSVVCESESKTATLCGFSEYEYSGATPPIEASVPPKKYLTETIFNSDSYNYTFSSGSCEGQIERSSNASWSRVDVYGTNPCSLTFGTVTPATRDTDYYSCVDGTSTFSYTSTSTNSATKPTFNDAQSNTIREFIYNEPGTDRVVTRRSTLSSEDTEGNALTRETATVGTSCSSLYQLRTTLFSFDYRTVTYTATASNLVIGVAYEGCVRIRKREAYSGTPPAGADTEWEDVEPDTISSFTATDTEEEIATDVVVPNVQGYEYEVVSAHVWPVSVGCDCPTSYSA